MPHVARARRTARALTPGLLTGFLATAAVLVASLLVGLANLQNLLDTTADVAHTYAVKHGLEQLLTTLLDAETGERGFVITGLASYLEPYDRATSQLTSQFADVGGLTTGSPDQRADLARLSAAADLKLAEIADAVRRRRESGFPAAQAAVADQVGKRIMDDMRVIVARMEAREDALLALRTAGAAQSYRTARVARFATTGVALVTLFALFVGTRRFGVQRVRAAETAERLKVTLASIGDGVLTTDAHGRVTQLNAVAEALTGWLTADAAGRPFEEVFVIINEQSRRPAENPIGKVLRDGAIVGLANHTVLIAKDGREIPVDDSAAPITADDGRITGVVMVFRDVTGRRQVERDREALVEAEQQARAEAETAERRLLVALEAGRMGTWQWTVGTGHLKWSPGLEAIHGHAPGTFPGRFDAFEREIHPDDRDRVLTAIAEAVEHRRDHHIEYRIVRADGTVRWVEGRGQLFVTADGRPDRLVGVCTDVTERKQAEDRFRLAIEAAPTPMVVVDREGIVAFVNALTERLFGYTRAEMVGKSIDHFVPARFRERHPAYRQTFTAEATRRPMGEGRDLFALHKDGSEVPVEIGLSPFETADGLFVVAAVTDITERKRLLDSERLAKQEAEQANRTKDQFLATVSHELRTPLNAIVGWAAVLQRGGVDDALQHRALKAISGNARRQAELIDELLDVSRIMSGKLRLERTAVDLRELVRAAVDTVQPAADRKRIHVTFDADSSLHTFYADHGRLQQVVVNLLSNAIKFTPDGGRVQLHVHRVDRAAEIVVRDTGQGITPDFLPLVFEPFRQADGSSTRQHGGLGLGLAIVKHIVDAHGGTVSADSPGEGQGAVFTVRLPIVAVIPDPEDADSLKAAPSRVLASQPDAGCLDQVVVLVVDDDADSRELVAATLELYGAAVVTAASAEEAFDLVRSRHLDVLLADVAMPREDGYSLIRRVRALEAPEAAALPAAALTSFAREEDRQEALDAGFQLHLTKPIDTRSLVEAVVSLAQGIQPR